MCPDVEIVEQAKSRCVALRHRLLEFAAHDPLPPPFLSLIRLVDAEQRSLSRRLPPTSSSPLASNIGYYESVARILHHPSVLSVSRVIKGIPSSPPSGPPVHVDVVATFGHSPAWFLVSDRNPAHLSWLGDGRLRDRVVRVLAAAHSAGHLKPAYILFVFSRGTGDYIANKLTEEFGAVEVDFFADGVDAEVLFDEMPDGWVDVRWSQRRSGRVFEIKIEESCIQTNVVLAVEITEGREKLNGSSDRFGSLVSKMSAHSTELVNFDTTALVAMVSGISNGGCEQLLKASEAEIQSRFKNNRGFVMAQVESELQRRILSDLEVLISGKKGICCESVLSEFKELVSMYGGPNEKLRASQLTSHLVVVPDCPSARLMELPTTRKIALKNKIAFGTGDHWQAPTLTANVGFVRAVSQAAMSLLTLQHRPRALVGD